MDRPHSARNARFGSARAAREAGIELATTATATSAMAAAAKVGGSSDVTPKISEASNQVAAAAPSKPAARPASASLSPSPTNHEGLDADADPAAYLPQHQLFANLGAGFERTMTLVIRWSNAAAANMSIVRAAVSSVDPQLAVGIVRTMEEVIDDSIAPRRLDFVLVSA